jgi:hypothetical protein
VAAAIVELIPGWLDRTRYSRLMEKAEGRKIREVNSLRGKLYLSAEVPFPLASSQEVTESILNSVTDRTRIALIDHVASPSVFPIQKGGLSRRRESVSFRENLQSKEQVPIGKDRRRSREH